MRLNITDLLREVGNTQTISESVRMEFPLDELDLIGEVELNLELMNTGELVLVEGEVKGVTRLPCSRCGKIFKTPLVATVEEEYRRHPPVVTDETEKELMDEDFIFSIAEDNMIDLSELVRQNLILSFPTKPLCSWDCPGADVLRPEEKKGDPRFDVLRKLFPKR